MSDTDISHLTVDDMLTAMRDAKVMEGFGFGWFKGSQYVREYEIEAYVVNPDDEDDYDLRLFTGLTLLEACRRAYKASIVSQS